MKDHVIDFSPSGAVAAMHTDKFSLGFLGQQKVSRASEIVFNESTQTWGVWLKEEGKKDLKPTAAWSGFVGYEEARAFEVEVLNKCRLQQVCPRSVEGHQIANETRKLQA